ncbi:unnamed protein product [Urochloa decumbens]|uniref:Uncharacterized protein n=1 Tax=Urochloa decumbens TaxID=240449 RepID=A0ABC9BU51_9POAL
MERHRRGSFTEKKNKGQADDFCAVDVLSLAQELKEQLATGNSLAGVAGGSVSPPSIIIAEVKRLIRNVNKAMYDPHQVSIGPYHLIENPDLAMYAEKVRSLGAVLSAASAGGTALEVYVDELERLEGQARSCYAHSFDNITSREFVRMLLLDGCYLLTRFGNVDMAKGHMPGDMMEALAVARDALYLAENQIPFFVLEKVYQLTYPGGSISAMDAIAMYVRELLRAKQYSISAAVPPVSQPGNLLHLVHMHLVPALVPSSVTGSSGAIGIKKVGRWRSATEYNFAGVKFRKRRLLLGPEGAQCILSVKLVDSTLTLEVPTLYIDAETLPLLRNLMALEQRNHIMLGSHVVTAYCFFISQIACTAGDVELLSRMGIIVHDRSNHGEVARSLADLCTGIMFRPDDPRCNYLRPVWLVLEMGYRSSLRWWMAWLWRSYLLWMAWLRHKYFTNPWVALGLVAATVGLACTIVQTVYSVMSYKQQGAN